MKKEDYIVGKFYFVKYIPNKTFLIIKCTDLQEKDPSRIKGIIISCMNNPEFEFRESEVFIGADRECRDATDEEIQWLSECIERKKFIPKTDITIKHQYEIY